MSLGLLEGTPDGSIEKLGSDDGEMIGDIDTLGP